MDSVHSYSMRDSGCVCWDFNPATLDLEYYRSKLTGLNRALKAISSHMKGELPVELMMKAHHIIMHEEQCNNLRGDMWYTAEGLALVGLKKEYDNES